jgi:hypothetical protein
MVPQSYLQLSSVLIGGLVGGLAAFAANLLRLRMERRWQRRNVAAALAAELEAICDHMTDEYVKRLELMDSAKLHHDLYPSYGFRGEKEYMPVFRVLGQSLGLLPRPLPRELVFWYTTMTVCLERARDLYELAKSQTTEPTRTAFAMTQLQRKEIARLLESAPPLIQRLEQLAQETLFPSRSNRRIR